MFIVMRPGLEEMCFGVLAFWRGAEVRPPLPFRHINVRHGLGHSLLGRGARAKKLRPIRAHLVVDLCCSRMNVLGLSLARRLG